MKQTSWIITIIVSLLSMFAPEFANLPAEIVNGLLTPLGYIGLIVLLTQVLKPLVWKVIQWEHITVVLSLVVAILLGAGAWFFNYGIFAEMQWYEMAVNVLIGFASSQGWYKLALNGEK